MISLDTNAVIAILNRNPAIAQRRLVSALAAREEVVISSIVLFELHFGAEKSGRPQYNRDRIEEFLAGGVAVVEFDSEDAKAAAILRVDLARAGRPIGPYEILIAAQARRRGAVIVTANKREFERVPGLERVDWSS